MVVLFPSLNVLVRDILRNISESHFFSFILHGVLHRLGQLKDLTWGLQKKIRKLKDKP